MKYRLDGKAHLISFGSYPASSLEEARKMRQEARSMIANGINPAEARRAKKEEKALTLEVNGNTFSRISSEWFAVQEKEWSASHAKKILDRLNTDVLPLLGEKLISAITTKDVLETLRLVESRQAFETAHRVKTIISQVFRYAKNSSVPGVISNPADGLEKVLVHHQVRSMPAILDPVTFGRLLVDIDNYAGTFIIKCALRIAPLVFVRPGELRHALWQDIDFDRAEWRIPAESMKMKMEDKAKQQGQIHAVPLSRQAVEILRELHPFTGRSKYVFPGRAASRVMSPNTINAALRVMGWDSETVCGHGFRATARTMLHERLNFSPDAIEAQLGHRVPDRLGSAYNRAKHLEERRLMMQVWADYIDAIKRLKDK